MPERSERILFVSHCILNQNTIASGLVKKGYTSAIWELAELCKGYDVGLEQMPCPEFRFREYPRKPDTKRGYDTQEFREICSEISEEVGSKIEKFEKAGFEVLGVVGIAGSPSCGVYETHLIEEKRDQEPGVFMEELKKRTDVPMVDLDYREPEESLEKIEGLFE